MWKLCLGQNNWRMKNWSEYEGIWTGVCLIFLFATAVIIFVAGAIHMVFR